VKNAVYMKCLSFSIALTCSYCIGFSSQYAHVNVQKYNVRSVLNQLNFNSRVINEKLSLVCCRCSKFVDSQVTGKLNLYLHQKPYTSN